MLSVPAQFPHVGSIAWLRPDPADPEPEGAPLKVRILRINADGTRLIEHRGPRTDLETSAHPELGRGTRATSKDATGNATVPAARLFRSRDEALKPPSASNPPKKTVPAEEPQGGVSKHRSPPRPRRSARPATAHPEPVEGRTARTPAPAPA